MKAGFGGVGPRRGLGLSLIRSCCLRSWWRGAGLGRRRGKWEGRE